MESIEWIAIDKSFWNPGWILVKSKRPTYNVQNVMGDAVYNKTAMPTYAYSILTLIRSWKSNSSQ